MDTPEKLPHWGWDQVDKSIEDEWSYTLLIDQERTDRRQVFSKLRKELERLEQFGTCDDAARSYHELPIDGSSRLMVLFERKSIEDVGDYFRIVSNIEEHDEMSDGMVLKLFEYGVSVDEDLLITRSDIRKRGQDDASCDDMDTIEAPWIWLMKNRVGQKLSREYKPAIPYDDSCGGEDFTRLINRRINAKVLLDITEKLGSVSLVAPLDW